METMSFEGAEAADRPMSPGKRPYVPGMSPPLGDRKTTTYQASEPSCPHVPMKIEDVV